MISTSDYLLLLRKRRIASASAPGVQTYSDKILAMGPVRYWRLNDTSGTVALDYSGNGGDGTYLQSPTLASITGIGDGLMAPDLNGVNQQVNIITPCLPVFNGALGSMFVWYKAADVGIWTDGSTRCAMNIGLSRNGVTIYKLVSSTITGRRLANNANKAVDIAGQTSTSWVHACVVWDKANDFVKFYMDGAQVGSTLTGLDVFGSPIAQACIGGLGSAITPTWKGSVAHAALFTRVLSDAEILSAATV